MGSKLEAKALMAAAGVPVLPGSAVRGCAPLGDGRARRTGFPLLVKAASAAAGAACGWSASAASWPDAVAAASREAASAFGDRDRVP